MPFFIRRYGSSLNFFGGPLEHTLKPIVKEPTKRTSRRQEWLCLELAKRQEEAGVAEESLVIGKVILTNFQSSVNITKNA